MSHPLHYTTRQPGFQHQKHKKTQEKKTLEISAQK